MHRDNVCLNGWWDFMPVYTENEDAHIVPYSVPTDGWLRKAYLVPGSWRKGEAQAETNAENKCREKDAPWLGFKLGDNFDYPRQWSYTKNAWIKSEFFVDKKQKGKRLCLRFNGVMPEAYVFVNGVRVFRNVDRTMPFLIDITDVICEGINELAVYITDNEKDENGKYLVFEGGMQTQNHCGIWQDVFFEEYPEFYISDLTIQTSIRDNMLTLMVEITNLGKNEVASGIEFLIKDGLRKVLDFKEADIRVLPGQSVTVSISKEWNTYVPWSPNHPKLYVLTAALCASGDAVSERFGFREFWINAHRFMLNGKPIHLSGDWGHKLSFDSYRPEYIRQWFGMLKDANMNYVRLHSYPHPEIVLDIADEMGILVSHESAWHFGAGSALRDQRLWENAFDHVRRIIRRGKNHPCIILWSIGNETRWSGDVEASIKLGEALRKLYNELDPTRPAYHEGDSSLWDERFVDIISRHYGVECTGEDWWDKSRPLHVGEMSKHHYGQPLENLIFGDDTVYSSYIKCSEAIAKEAADIIEQARANEVGCICPWNLSCLDNYRPLTSEERLEWPDYSTPGVKPLRCAPYGPEFNWLENDSKGYVEGPSFPIIAHAYRKIAAVIRERLSGAYNDELVSHTVTIVNDSGGMLKGSLAVCVMHNGETIFNDNRPIEVASGFTQRFEFQLGLPELQNKSKVLVVTEIRKGQAVMDRHKREIWIYPSFLRDKPVPVKMAVYVLGDGYLKEFFACHGIQAVYVRDFHKIDTSRKPIVIIEKNAVKQGSDLNRQVEKILGNGCRVLVLEQNASIFPAVSLEAMPIERCHIRSRVSPVFDNIDDKEMMFWGNDPYGKRQSDAWVTETMYRKPTAGNIKILADGGKGDFGFGGLQWTPLFEYRMEQGIILACQLNITERLRHLPAADKLLLNMLQYLESYVVPERMGAFFANDDGTIMKTLESIGMKRTEMDTGEMKSAVLEPATLDKYNNTDAAVFVNGSLPLSSELAFRVKEYVVNGGTALIWNINNNTKDSYSKLIDNEIEICDLPEAYSLIRKGSEIHQSISDKMALTGNNTINTIVEYAPNCDALLDGISHHETFWFEKVQYGPADKENRVITQTLLKIKNDEKISNNENNNAVEELLISERATCWREFYIFGGNAEVYRMPVLTCFLSNGLRPYGAALIRIKSGAGQFILCQIVLPEPKHDKSRLFWSTLLNNLNISLNGTDANLLLGSAVAAASKKSDGFAKEIAYIINPGESILQEIIALSRPTEYRLPNQVLIAHFPWNRCICENDGSIIPQKLDYSNGGNVKQIVFMFQINPGKPRKLIQVEGGLPNPDLQTYLDLEGDGKAYVWINGKKQGDVQLKTGKPATISGIDLEKDWNSCIIVYEPSNAKIEFKHLWRNIHHAPETEFKFISSFNDTY